MFGKITPYAAAMMLGLVSAQSSIIGTVTPCPDCPATAYPAPITVTSQFEAVSTCVPETSCTAIASPVVSGSSSGFTTTTTCAATPSCSTYDFVNTTIPVYAANGALTSTAVTSTDQPITVSYSFSTATSSISRTLAPSASGMPAVNFYNGTAFNGNSTQPEVVIIKTVTEFVFVVPFNQLGPYAINGYPGSGAPGTGPDSNGVVVQPVQVNECADGSCVVYTETRTYEPQTYETTSVSSVSTAVPAPTNGLYTVTIFETVPVTVTVVDAPTMAVVDTTSNAVVTATASTTSVISEEVNTSIVAQTPGVYTIYIMNTFYITQIFNAPATVPVNTIIYSTITVPQVVSATVTDTVTVTTGAAASNTVAPVNGSPASSPAGAAPTSDAASATTSGAPAATALPELETCDSAEICPSCNGEGVTAGNQTYEIGCDVAGVGVVLDVTANAKRDVFTPRGLVSDFRGCLTQCSAFERCVGVNYILETLECILFEEIRGAGPRRGTNFGFNRRRVARDILEAIEDVIGRQRFPPSSVSSIASSTSVRSSSASASATSASVTRSVSRSASRSMTSSMASSSMTSSMASSSMTSSMTSSSRSMSSSTPIFGNGTIPAITLSGTGLPVTIFPTSTMSGNSTMPSATSCATTENLCPGCEGQQVQALNSTYAIDCDTSATGEILDVTPITKRDLEARAFGIGNFRSCLDQCSLFTECTAAQFILETLECTLFRTITGRGVRRGFQFGRKIGRGGAIPPVTTPTPTASTLATSTVSASTTSSAPIADPSADLDDDIVTSTEGALVARATSFVRRAGVENSRVYRRGGVLRRADMEAADKKAAKRHISVKL